MFESDDYDQVLSQLDLPEINTKIHAKEPDSSQNNALGVNTKISGVKPTSPVIYGQNAIPNNNLNEISIRASSPEITCNSTNKIDSPRHVKRKLINCHFDHKSKRKFPGPAGLLSGSFEEKKDENIGQMELFSQDIDFTQNHINGDQFDTPLWKRLLEDTKNLKEINSIKTIKQQALAGNLEQKKAQNVIAFVESVDRSAIDPLITLRDNTGYIKCTLHRDAWTAFSAYIVADYCALHLWKSTVLTTGSAFKKHYLNITISNIAAIYSSAILNEEHSLPDGFQKIYEEEYTIIKIERDKKEINFSASSEKIQEDLDILNDLDGAFFDDMF